MVPGVSLVSRTELLPNYDLLDDRLKQDTEDHILGCAEGNEFKIDAKISRKMACHWRLYEVHVDAIKINT